MQPNSNVIANPKSAAEPAVKGPEMNDRDRLNDVLATAKYLTDGLNSAAREASHQQLHQDLMTVLTETHQAARDAFNAMFQFGWYKLEHETQNKLDQAHQQFQNYTAQLPYPNTMQ
ncbi:MAG: spore coat protein [Alicyclobacillaceae bacterium]|nr:spore coat protein [Alicyclobacillaceae bacterium]